MADVSKGPEKDPDPPVTIVFVNRRFRSLNRIRVHHETYPSGLPGRRDQFWSGLYCGLGVEDDDSLQNLSSLGVGVSFRAPS